jgi:hypothetical protein
MINHKSHFILSVKSYTFWQQGAILREFSNNKSSYCKIRGLSFINNFYFLATLFNLTEIRIF